MDVANSIARKHMAQDALITESVDENQGSNGTVGTVVGIGDDAMLLSTERSRCMSVTECSAWSTAAATAKGESPQRLITPASADVIATSPDDDGQHAEDSKSCTKEQPFSRISKHVHFESGEEVHLEIQQQDESTEGAEDTPKWILVTRPDNIADVDGQHSSRSNRRAHPAPLYLPRSTALKQPLLGPGLSADNAGCSNNLVAAISRQSAASFRMFDIRPFVASWHSLRSLLHDMDDRSGIRSCMHPTVPSSLPTRVLLLTVLSLCISTGAVVAVTIPGPARQWASDSEALMILSTLAVLVILLIIISVPRSRLIHPWNIFSALLLTASTSTAAAAAAACLDSPLPLLLALGVTLITMLILACFSLAPQALPSVSLQSSLLTSSVLSLLTFSLTYDLAPSHMVLAWTGLLAGLAGAMALSFSLTAGLLLVIIPGEISHINTSAVLLQAILTPVLIIQATLLTLHQVFVGTDINKDDGEESDKV
ncbi:hypothetical protein CEUSTIGMA_g1662.t1 [Chlamydomonas eustigma]|uniref:Uncharacterized protein n=1 Tax=Chlamydomonas eustigma TaxID=1157962 RepID=A0A250WTR4_9CHLO|nr:hypothetical protein CEUSTIGMA_g1662.t1 [Chlamydomonas eustigma]|eukprot:GAX74213.1 hypothetical protein CEUSTIGMA_g1662.t1 [Chlamydomonas eustigma]